MKKFKGLFAAAALIAAVLVPTTSSSAALVAPKTAWSACSEIKVTYCVESVSVQMLGGLTETLTYTPATAQDPKKSSEHAGYWTSETWAENHLTAGYDGLAVKIAPANAYVPHLYMDVIPVKFDGTKVTTAYQEGSDSAAVDLLLDETITFKANYGEILPGINIGQGMNINVADDGKSFTISGNPVSVSFSENTNNYLTGDSIADSTSNSLSVFMVIENDDMGMGVEGLTGKMSVTTNAPDTSTPTWNASTGEMTWIARAPHFKSDGETINDGFYRSVIPAADAAILFGLTNPADAAKALKVTIANNVSGKTVAISKITYNTKLKAIVIEHSGFQYSKNSFKIKRNPTYKKFASLKMRTCVQIKPSAPGPNTLKQKAGACGAGYRAK